MKLTSIGTICILLFIVFNLTALGAEDDSNLNGLLNGQYGYTERLTCIMAKAGQGGMHSAPPHFTEVSPGTYQLLVEGESSTLINYGVAEFDGTDQMHTLGGALMLNSDAVNIGDTVNMFFPPGDCLGTYHVSSDRTFTVQDANCTQQIPGEPPMVGEVGPFSYSGYISSDGMTVIMYSPSPIKGTNTIKLTDGTIIDQWEGVCVSTQVLVKMGSEPVNFAQFANGGGITSEIVLINPSTQLQAKGTIKFKDDSGNDLTVGLEGEAQSMSQVDFTLPPTGSKAIKTDGKGAVEVGSASATSASPLSGVIRFGLPGIGVSGVNQSPSLTEFIIPAQNHTDGVATALAIQNTGNDPVDVELSLRDEDGVNLATVQIEGLAGNGHVAKYLTELFTGVDLSDFEGTVVGRVDKGSVAATALELDAQSGTFTTLPVTPLM